MSYFLTEDQAQWQKVARSYAMDEVEPLANSIDEDAETPTSLIARAAELGFFGLYIPEAYGGHGKDLTTVGVVLEEIAKASPGLAGLLSVQMVLCPASVLATGTEEQKQRLLVPSARGQNLIAYSQTEPSGATNVASHLTRLTADGDGYRLNGAKLFCTQGEAQKYLVMCNTTVGDTAGYGCVIVDRDAEGFAVADLQAKLGWRGTNTRGISFTDVRIAADDILGNPLSGAMDVWEDANEANFLTHAITSLGAVEGLFAKTLERVKSRELYGGPMYRMQPIAFWMSDIYGKIQAMRALAYTATRLIDEKDPQKVMMGSVCKAQICESAFSCINTLVQLWGGSGMMNETGVNRYLRDARVNSIAEGANEVHNWLIAQQVLQLT